MAKAHNKKRNVGVIYEILVKYIAECMVEKRDNERKIASRIIKKYYSPGTELFKEYRLFKSLIETTVSNSSVAGSILLEAKRASRSLNLKQLDKEKSNLIREINYQLDGSSIYGMRVDEYRIYATVQTTLNEWRKDVPDDLRRLAEYEDKIVSWLTESKDSNDPWFDDKKDVDSFVVKIMAEKFNERYSSSLEEGQKRLLKKYVFSDDKSEVRDEMISLTESAIRELDNYKTDSQYVMNKVNHVKAKIMEQDFAKVNDKTVEKSLTLLSMMNQLKKEQDNV